MKKKLLVFGSSGLMGSSIVRLLSNDFNIISPSHKHVDVTNFSQIKKTIQSSRPDLIINAAGLADMEKAEADSNLAYNLNTKPSEYITQSLRGSRIPYYYISTDAVFGESMDNIPYNENDSIIPISVYAKSKAKGEEISIKSSSINGVIRITLPYSSNFKGKSDLVRDVFKTLEKGQVFYGITDQMINPISCDDAAFCIKDILLTQASGIYHVAANNFMSNYDFVVLVDNTFSLNGQFIKKIKLLDFQKNKKAHRSHYCVLGVKRFLKDFGMLPSIEESLSRFKINYSN